MSGYSDGIYPIEALSVCEEMPPQMPVFPGPETPIFDDASFASAIGGVDAALVGTGARGNSPVPVDQFVRVGGRSSFDTYARRVTPN